MANPSGNLTTISGCIQLAWLPAFSLIFTFSVEMLLFLCFFFFLISGIRHPPPHHCTQGERRIFLWLPNSLIVESFAWEAGKIKSKGFPLGVWLVRACKLGYWLAVRRCRRCWAGCSTCLGSGKTRCSSALVKTARLGDEHGARSGKSAGVELGLGWRGEGCGRRWGCSKKKRSKMSSGGNGSEQDLQEVHRGERFDFSRSVQAVLSTGTLGELIAQTSNWLTWPAVAILNLMGRYF